jgi:hypothetical protein
MAVRYVARKAMILVVFNSVQKIAAIVTTKADIQSLDVHMHLMYVAHSIAQGGPEPSSSPLREVCS